MGKTNERLEVTRQAIGVRADVEIVDHSPLPKQTDGAILSVLFSDWKEEPSVDED